MDTTVTLFMDLRHTGHTPNSPLDLLGLQIDEEVAGRIQQLTLIGTKFRSLQLLLKEFSDKLVVERGLEGVDRQHDVRFYPSDTTIRNHMWKAVTKQRMHQVDQEAVRQLTSEHTQRNPADSCFFRPAGDGQPFLLVMQTAEQRRMLQLYGQTIVGMDATYKTNQWGFPLFMLNVVTNRGKGYPVAVFLLEQEDGSRIAEALKLISSWNPTWHPKYFMLDKSDAEFNAVKAAQPDSKVLLCDFHRLQAWYRWIRDSKHGVGDKE